MLLQDAVEKFLVSLEANGRATKTIETYEWRLNHFRQFLGSQGITAIEEVQHEDLDAWAVSMRRADRRWEDHPLRPEEDGGLSDATIAGRIQAVKTFLIWCVKRRYIDQSPAEHLQKPHVDLAADDRVMDADDFMAIFDQAVKLARSGRRLHLRDLAIVTFVYETGCRPGEMLSLRISWLDLENHEATVNGKTGRRLVDFTGTTSTVMINWLNARPQVDHDIVFVSRTGSPLTESGLYQIFKRLAQGAGVEGRFNPQAVRHLVGQTFTDRANLKLASDKLGHRSVTTTAMFYAHQDRTRLKDATRRLSMLNKNEDKEE